ncbi:MAG TPA: N-acetylmuramoyl-L-alanine amidase [Chthoniobacterales bacterium]|jgi:N-acetylmuramoyl-L-alanine amidase|nr:N-acetylmuramoyl-L-alanine amidase [Chthoniobacterales bacterium]
MWQSSSQRSCGLGWLSIAGLACALASPSQSSASQSKSRDTSAQTSSSTVVVIDAGHGGFDRGGIPSQRIAEKTMTLDVALRLRKKLIEAGYRVVMTRDSDVFVPLPGRVSVANSNQNAIFICIHFNSATRTEANGIETYYYRRDAMALAANIHRNVIAGAPSENRGIRRRGYYVLRKTNIPAVLVECGFLTNPAEGQLALTAAYRDKLAEEITRGILGKPALVARAPASHYYPPATEVEAQPFNGYVGTDFIKAPPESSSARHRKRSKGTRSKRSSHQTTAQRTKSGDHTPAKKSMREHAED